MKNISPYSEEPFDFHKEIISKKNNTTADPDYKAKVSALNTNVKIAFTKYSRQYGINKLELLIPFGYSGSNKTRLLKLYNFKTKKIQELKIKMTTKSGNIIDNICQNCTISEVNSFDHILPKDEYSEYVVNPINLFPSCTKCNSYKGTTWLNGGKRFFLNLYSDILPTVQYLFVKINIDKENNVELDYFLENIHGVDPDMFALLQSHYQKLNLYQRFKENSDLIISDLSIEINKYKSKISIDDIKEIILDECIEHKMISGNNYWKSILKIALINDTEYMNQFY